MESAPSFLAAIQCVLMRPIRETKSHSRLMRALAGASIRASLQTPCPRAGPEQCAACQADPPPAHPPRPVRRRPGRLPAPSLPPPILKDPSPRRGGAGEGRQEAAARRARLGPPPILMDRPAAAAAAASPAPPGQGGAGAMRGVPSRPMRCMMIMQRNLNLKAGPGLPARLRDA
jgi:hypothetical protein